MHGAGFGHDEGKICNEGAPGLRSSRRLVKFCNLLKISVRMSTNSGLSKLCCEFSRGAVAAVAATNCFSMGLENLSKVLWARLQDLEPLSDFVASGWVLKEKTLQDKALKRLRRFGLGLEESNLRIISQWLIHGTKRNDQVRQMDKALSKYKASVRADWHYQSTKDFGATNPGQRYDIGPNEQKNAKKSVVHSRNLYTT